MSTAVAPSRRNQEVQLHPEPVHSYEVETKNRAALLLVRRVLRDTVVVPFGGHVHNGTVRQI